MFERETVRVATREAASPKLDFAARLEAAIKASTEHMVKVQYPEGYWWGELEANVCIHAEYLLLTHFLGVPNKASWQKIVNYLKHTQLSDGGWPVWYGGPSDVNCTVEAYFALKLAGVDPEAPEMVRARDCALRLGGVPQTRVFTKMWLALFGQWSWRGTPMLPVEKMLLPNWFPINIYEFASWARGTIVACMILLTLRPICPIPEYAKLDELYPLGREKTRYTFGKTGPLFSVTTFFRGVDFALRVADLFPKPLRKRALKKAEQWIVERQEADGSWGGIQPPWVYSLMALKCLGYSVEHPMMKKGLEGFETFARETETMFWTDPCVSPVWDTCLGLLAMQDAGLPREHPALVKATNWLLDNQILEHAGDWLVKRPKLKPGGWAFEFHNVNYPDIDDTAMVLIALHKMGWQQDSRMRQSLARGLAWMEGMQSKNGGFGSFDVDNTKKWVTKVPFCDFGEVIDPPTEDVTAHALEYLGRAGLRADHPGAARALAYLKATQQTDGSWWGRWGVNYIYGIGAVLPALKWLGEDMRQSYVRKAVEWLKRYQREDGGWGEGCESYAHPALRGQGPSTPSQTAWALLGLIAADETDSDSVRRGVEYLLAMQQAHGSWDEPQFTGTGFPTDFMINYHMYRDYWPLMALGQYRTAVTEKRMG